MALAAVNLAPRARQAMRIDFPLIVRVGIHDRAKRLRVRRHTRFLVFGHLSDNKESTMEQVKQMVEAGVSLSTAIKEAIGQSVTSWADKHGLSRQIASEVLNSERSPRVDVCEALAMDLGSDAYSWALELWGAARPNAERFAREAIEPETAGVAAATDRARRVG
jgi:hypothetical protein